jgi:hypothetical protein
VAEKPILSLLISSPQTFYNNLQLTQVSEAIHSKTPPIGLLTKAINNGDVLVKGLIVNGLTDLALFVNVGENSNFSTNQIAQTTELILEDFKHLKIEDFKLFFNKVKKGHYGKLFNRLDGQVILEQLHVYSNERAAEAEQINFKAHSQHKSEVFNQNEINPDGQKKVLEILKDAIKKPEQIKPEKKERVKSTYEILIQRFYRQFTKIALKRNYDDSYRFIFMYGKVINANEYVEIKIKQHDRVHQLLTTK